jgi:chromosomal replication initiation ATPase DnaA
VPFGGFLFSCKQGKIVNPLFYGEGFGKTHHSTADHRVQAKAISKRLLYITTDYFCQQYKDSVENLTKVLCHLAG